MIRLKLLLQSLLLPLGVGLVSFLVAGGSGNVRSFYQLLPKPELPCRDGRFPGSGQCFI